MPIGIRHPQHIIHESTLRLPEEWSVETNSGVFENSAFHFSHKVSLTGRTLRLAYELRTFADHVTVDQARDYVADVDRVEDELNFELYYPAAASVGFFANINYPIMLLVALTLFGSSWLAFRYLRSLPVLAPNAFPLDSQETDADSRWKHEAGLEAGLGEPRTDPQDATREYRSIGGWLILLAFGITVTPPVLAYHFFTTMQAVSLSNWTLLTTPGGAFYHALYAPMLVFEVCTIAVRLVASILLAVLFYQRRRGLPRFYVAFMVFTLATLFIDLLLAGQISGSVGETIAEGRRQLFSTLVGLLIWGNYLHRSERPKLTFVR